MFCLNKITLIGHLGKDPEVKTLPSGHLVVTLKLATSEVYKDKEGKWQQQTEWHTLILWNKLAEFASQHFIK
jgi:single-strand DNA-binding protein